MAELGLHFVSIPVRGADDLTEANARKLGEALNAAGSKPLLLHCGSAYRAGLKSLRPVVAAQLGQAAPH